MDNLTNRSLFNTAMKLLHEYRLKQKACTVKDSGMESILFWNSLAVSI